MQNHNRTEMKIGCPHCHTLRSPAGPKLWHYFGRFPHLPLLLLCKWRQQDLFPGGCLYTEALLACLGWA